MYAFIPMVLFYGSKIVKIGFLFSVNAYAFIPGVLLWLKIVDVKFLFGVNVYSFISMVLFYC